jgi:hypothetical protein
MLPTQQEAQEFAMQPAWAYESYALRTGCSMLDAVLAFRLLIGDFFNVKRVWEVN